MKSIPTVDKRIGHALSLRQQIIISKNNWFKENQQKVQCERFDNDLGIRLILKNLPEQNILDEWGLLLGDCIHNLRSALDNLAYELACIKCNPPNDPRSIFFPIFKNRSSFNSRNTKSCLEQLPTDAANLIEAIQPFQRDGLPGNGTPDSDILSLLHEVECIDKHRIPSPVLLIPVGQEHLISYSLEENEFALPDAFYIRQEPLEPDCIIAEYKFPQRIHLKGNVNIKINLSIVFNNKTFEIDEFISLLLIYTNQIVGLFRVFFPNNPDIKEENLLLIDVTKNDDGFQFKQHEKNPN